MGGWPAPLLWLAPDPLEGSVRKNNSPSPPTPRPPAARSGLVWSPSLEWWRLAWSALPHNVNRRLFCYRGCPKWRVLFFPWRFFPVFVCQYTWIFKFRQRSVVQYFNHDNSAVLLFAVRDKVAELFDANVIVLMHLLLKKLIFIGNENEKIIGQSCNETAVYFIRQFKI